MDSILSLIHIISAIVLNSSFLDCLKMSWGGARQNGEEKGRGPLSGLFCSATQKYRLSNTGRKFSGLEKPSR